MNKSIIIFILVTLLLFGFWLMPVVAWGNDEQQMTDVSKTLIVEKNTGAEDLLNYKGHTIISSNVNFKQAGEYIVNYLTNDDDIISKTVIVVDSGNEYYQEYLLRQNSNTYNYDIMASCQENDNLYGYAYRLKPKTNDIGLSDFFIDIFDNNEKVVSSLLFYRVRARVNALTFDGNFVIGVGYYQNLYGITQALLFRVNLETRHIERFYYGEDNVTTGENIYITDDAYFLVGKTQSEKPPFNGVRKGNDGFILKIDKVTLEVTNTIMTGLNGEDKASDIIIKQNYLYVMQKYGPNFEQNRLLKLDLFGNTIKSFDFVHSYQLDVKKFFINNKQIYVLISSYQYNIQGMKDTLYQIDEDLKLKVIFETADLSWEINDIIINKNNIMSLLYYKKKTKTGYRIQSIDIDNNEIYLDHRNFDSSINPHSLTSQNRILGHDTQTMSLIRIDYDFIKTVKPESPIVETNLFNPSYLTIINHNRVIHDETLSKYDYDLDYFGIYPGRLVFENSRLQFVKKIDWEVQPLVSIKNGEIYDKNLLLTFNGTGMLNNQAIENGYVIKNPGDYILQLMGKDNIIKIYQFKIADLSYRVIESSEKRTDQSAQVDKGIKHNPNKVPSLNFIPSFDIQTNYQLINNQQWYYLFPVCAVLAGIIVLFKRK